MPFILQYINALVLDSLESVDDAMWASDSTETDTKFLREELVCGPFEIEVFITGIVRKI
jgi:hypothetical protein